MTTSTPAAAPRTLGVGLISVGWMGRLHTRAYKGIAERYPELNVRTRLVVAADPVPASQAEAVNLLGYERAVADYHEVLADPEVDVVSICAPNFLHKEMALAAAAAGKPFWIEKPMGRSAAESAEIAAAVAAAELVTAVGFNYRHAPAVEKARDLIRSGALGRVTNVRGAFFADYSSDPAGALTWRFIRERAGSGVLGDLLSHGLDLAQYLVGRIGSATSLTETFITERAKPSGAAASHFSRAEGTPEPVENEDYAALLIRFDNGAVGTFESSRISIGPRADYSIEVYGTKGSLRWNFQRMNELEVCLGTDGGAAGATGAAAYGYTTMLTSPGHGDFGRFQPGGGTGMGFDDLKTIEAAQFLSSVLTGEQLAPSVADGWAAAEIVAAAEASADDRAWHDVKVVTGPLTYDRV
ncbi:Gfo/Idh/MocA family protein [Frondihabitans cladoniiphilus]|uniref:Gfo/Idh/MocA family oxidoreductase n=1 Tax=Frondihabitans cladoniiphilus TaxID=715785 RepID=A0ABP8W0D4_9MICO